MIADIFISFYFQFIIGGLFLAVFIFHIVDEYRRFHKGYTIYNDTFNAGNYSEIDASHIYSPEGTTPHPGEFFLKIVTTGIKESHGSSRIIEPSKE